MKLKILVLAFALLLSAVAFAQGKGGDYGLVGTNGASANYETHHTGKAFRAHVYDKEGNYLGKTKWRNSEEEAEEAAIKVANGEEEPR